jgi:hypothetical protein
VLHRSEDRRQQLRYEPSILFVHFELDVALYDFFDPRRNTFQCFFTTTFCGPKLNVARS